MVRNHNFTLYLISVGENVAVLQIVKKTRDPSDHDDRSSR